MLLCFEQKCARQLMCQVITLFTGGSAVGRLWTLGRWKLAGWRVNFWKLVGWSGSLSGELWCLQLVYSSSLPSGPAAIHLSLLVHHNPSPVWLLLWIPPSSPSRWTVSSQIVSQNKSFFPEVISVWYWDEKRNQNRIHYIKKCLVLCLKNILSQMCHVYSQHSGGLCTAEVWLSFTSLHK